MSRALATIAAVLVILGTAGAASAAEQWTHAPNDNGDAHNPWCYDKQPAIGTNQAGVGVTLQQDLFGKQVYKVCSGEHWDSQDPNNKSSESDTTANENGDGEVYVNPLGDCSGWEASEHSGGCSGGTEKPSAGNPLDVRATADVDSGAVTGEDQTQATVYVHEEIWGVGVGANAVHVDYTDRNGYVAVYLEDHTNQVFDFTGITAPGAVCPDSKGNGEGNVLACFVGLVQNGVVAEGDCTQDKYDGSDEDGGGKQCPRDNTAITVEYGLKWVPGQSALPDNPGGQAHAALP